jgi:hypothetical protein
MAKRNQSEITLCLFSDTHELHRDIEMPEASLYLCAGDFTTFSRSMAAVRDFDAWLGELGAPVVLTAGNHESFLEADPSKRSLLPNATMLINQSARIAGIKILGLPVVPLAGTAFGMPSAAERRRVCSTIPDDTDIIITHVTYCKWMGY